MARQRDRSVWDEADCIERCAMDPQRTSCPCDDASLSPEICYSGPDWSRGVGPCRDGLRSCQDGRWSACEGETLPTEEVCNGVDDDCGGGVDDALFNSCGECAPQSQCFHVGVGGEPFDEGRSEGVVFDEDCLTLAAGQSQGTWQVIIDVGSYGSVWRRLDIDASGSGAFLTFDARSASTEADLATEPLAPLCDPHDGTTSCSVRDLFGSLLELRATLSVTGDTPPKLCAVRVAWTFAYYE